MNKIHTKICEVVDAWPPHSFIHRHVSSMNKLEESLFPIAIKPAKDSSNQDRIQYFGGKQFVSILPQLRLPFLLSLLPGARRSLTSTWGIRLKQWQMRRKLLPVFKEIRPHLIHFHWMRLAISWRWIPETLGIPYTVSLRGSEVRLLASASVERREQIRTTLEHAAGIHTVNHGLGRDLEYDPFGQLPSTTIYTCVPFPPLLPPYPKIGKDSVQFLAVGNLTWQKGYPYLLSALKQLKEQQFPWTLTMAGYGLDEDRIRYWINQFGLQSQVQLLGKVNPSKVQQLYETHHAFLQSSISEGLSNSIAEAMANGCPVFATKVGGTAEVIQDGQNGFLLTPMKPETWIEKLKLVKDSSFMMRIRERAYDTVKRKFSSENHANQFMTFYKKAITHYQSRLHGLHRRYPVANQDKGMKGFLQEDMRKILVLGDWEWPLGVDGVIRVLGEIIQKAPHALICRVVGCGTQKEELQYLCNFMHVLQYVEFVEVTKDDESQIKRIQEEWGDLIIICHRYGEFGIRNSENSVAVKSLEELERALLFYLDPNPKISASTSV